MASGPFILTTPEGLSDFGRTVSIGLALLGIAKVPTWDKMPPGLAGLDVELSEEQLALLERREGILAFIRDTVPSKQGTGGRPMVTIAECDTCPRWMIVSGAGVPKKCPLKTGCTGTMTKVKKATKKRAERDGN